MLIIERGAGHMAMGRALDIQVDGASVGRLKQHESIIVQREPGEHELLAILDDAPSFVLRVRLAADHDTRVQITLYPRLSWRNVVRRRSDAFRFVVQPPADAVTPMSSAR